MPKVAVEIIVVERAIAKWWESLSRQSRGDIAGGLVLFENLRTNSELNIEAHKALNSDQLKNATSANVQKVLLRHGEERSLSKEGGRTNRGLMTNLTGLLDVLLASGMNQLNKEDKVAVIERAQAFLSQKATEKLNTPKLSFNYRREITSRDAIAEILDVAKKRGKHGDVAEYLVGAKLALRFPNYNIRNSAASAADDQTAEHGDFQINDCVFHVTIAPNMQHYEKCKNNLANGLRVFVLVPDDKLVGARQIVSTEIQGSVSIESIESFVSQNIEELSDFSSEQISASMGVLLEKYNDRVTEVETDLSLLITIPASLVKK